MRTLALCVVCVLSVASQDKRVFTDLTRGYSIDCSKLLNITAGSRNRNRSIRDTSYLAVYFAGARVLFGEFQGIESKVGSGFREFAKDVSISWCGSGGPDESTWAEDIDSIEVKANKHGVTYARLFLRRRTSSESGNESEIVGPFYVIDISTSRSRQSLFLRWQFDWRPSSAQIKACEAIVDGIKMLRR